MVELTMIIISAVHLNSLLRCISCSVTHVHWLILCFSYRFCVYITVGLDTDFDCMDVKIMNNNPPTIERDMTPINQHNPDEKLIINTNVCYPDGFLLIEWVSIDASGEYNKLATSGINHHQG